MSDDEDELFVKKMKTVHYGSLEEQEKLRLAAAAAAGNDNDDSDSVGKGLELGDIHISNEYMDLEDDMSKDKQALLEEFERRRKARQLNVSTDDDEVRRNLRQLGEPVCLFGEGPAERRVRLRDLLSFLGEDAIHKRMEEEEARMERRRGQEGTWYHEGPPELREARVWIAHYSLPRAQARLAAAREQLQVAPSVRTAARQEAQRKAAAFSIYCSQVGDTRPLSYCRFSDDSKMLVTSSWSGTCKVWSVPECMELQTLRGHTCNVSCVAFRPGAVLPEQFKDKIAGIQMEDGCEHIIDEKSEVCSMISCAYDGTVHLWNFVSDEPIASLPGHSPHRVSRVSWHPSGRLAGAACWDASWRLWDVERGAELLHQEGHAREVYCIEFQCDGSLAGTGGMDSFGRVWDLRTGRCVMFLEGHLRGVLSLDWSPTGYQLATGSADNTVKIWDLRRRSMVYTIPAHTSLVSGVRYQRTNGHYLLTCSYDNSAKLWSNPTWQPLRTLQGHDGKVMGADITPDGQYIVTCSYDRTFKLWAPELS